MNENNDKKSLLKNAENDNYGSVIDNVKDSQPENKM